jgi:hypothetical protein
MKRLLTRARPSVIGLALIAVLSLAGTAIANRAIRDNTINTRDIKDNQVNTRDLRDGAIRGVDIHAGSVGISSLAPDVAAEVGTATLFDPRAHRQDDDLSWARGPAAISESVSPSSDPLPGPTSGQAWRDVILDPGTYLVETTGYASEGASGSEGVATRLFLGGKPLAGGVGYGLAPLSSGPLPSPSSSSAVIDVPAGDATARQLVERVVGVGGAATFADDFVVLKVSPR